MGTELHSGNEVNVLIPAICSSPVLEAFPDNKFVTVDEKEASFPKAFANLFKVFKAEGAESTKFDKAVWTKAVDAIWFVFVPAKAVSTVGIPGKFILEVNLGLVMAESANLEEVTA